MSWSVNNVLARKNGRLVQICQKCGKTYTTYTTKRPLLCGHCAKEAQSILREGFRP